MELAINERNLLGRVAQGGILGTLARKIREAEVLAEQHEDTLDLGVLRELTGKAQQVPNELEKLDGFARLGMVVPAIIGGLIGGGIGGTLLKMANDGGMIIGFVTGMTLIGAATLIGLDLLSKWGAEGNVARLADQIIGKYRPASASQAS